MKTNPTTVSKNPQIWDLAKSLRFNLTQSLIRAPGARGLKHVRLDPEGLRLDRTADSGGRENEAQQVARTDPSDVTLSFRQSKEVLNSQHSKDYNLSEVPL